MIRLAALPLIALPLIACTPNPYARRVNLPPPAQVQPTPCGAEKAYELIGKKRTPQLVAEVARLTGTTVIRWIAPGTAVTMDYREDRVNVSLDDDDVITGIKCG